MSSLTKFHSKSLRTESIIYRYLIAFEVKMYSWSNRWANQSMIQSWNYSWPLALFEILPLNESQQSSLTTDTQELPENDKRVVFPSQCRILPTFWSEWESIKSSWLTLKALILEDSLAIEWLVTILTSVSQESSICLTIFRWRIMITVSLFLQTRMELNVQNRFRQNSWDEDSILLDLQRL